MPVFEKPVDPAEIDADDLAFEVTAQLLAQRGASVDTVGTKGNPRNSHPEHAVAEE
jgi:hypothetical protein